MFDGSKLPLEENIRATEVVVNLTRHLDVPVEGELGHVGAVQDDRCLTLQTRKKQFFSRKSGVAALAVMVGTAHGCYTQAPQLALERLAKN